MFAKILVPLDGTPESAVALPPAQALARATGAQVILVRATPPGSRDSDLDQAAEAQAGLDRISGELASSGVQAMAVARRGDPGEAILDELRGRGADLVVMATHGRGGISRAVIGSVAQHVLTHARIPVLLVRPGEHRMTRIRTLLVPVDGTPGGAVATGAALALARSTGARIVVVRAVVPTPPYVYAGDAWMGAAGPYYIDPAWEEDWLLGAQSYVDRLAAHLRHAGVRAEGRALSGSVVETIEAAADDADADLIVMSTHALTGPARALLGSVADAVARTSHRPVLLVRRDSPVAFEARDPIEPATATPSAKK